MGLNRIQETPPNDEEIKKLFRLPQPGLPKEVSDESISAFFRGVPVAPESTALPISQDRQLTPAVGAGLKPREEDPLAGLLGVADTIPFISEIPGVRERFEKARRIAPGAFKFGQIGGTIATGVGALAGAKALIRFTPKVISSIAKRAIPLLTKNKKAQAILVRAGIDVTEGAIADGLFNAIQGELPNVKDLAIFAAVDAALPTAFKVVGKVVKKLKPTKEIIPEAKKIIPGAQVTKQTPTKITPEGQRVVSKPVSTGEAIKLPKETKLRETTSARKFDMSKDRETIGLDALNSPERKKFQESLDNARTKGFDEKALDLADEVLEKPKAFNDEETAGVVLKAVELKNTHEDLHRQLKKAIEGSDTEKTLLADIERAEEKFDKLSEALRISGTEKGRALVSQKLTINRDFDLVFVLNRGKVAKQTNVKGAKLDPKEKARFKELTDKLAARTKRVEELEKEVSRKTANAVLKRSKGTKKFAKMSRVERDAVLNDTLEKAKKLIDEGCIISG